MTSRMWRCTDDETACQEEWPGSSGCSLPPPALRWARPPWRINSQSEFDFKLNVEIEGKVTKLEWKSPHARLYIDVVNKDGKTENWNSNWRVPPP